MDRESRYASAIPTWILIHPAQLSRGREDALSSLWGRNPSLPLFTMPKANLLSQTWLTSSNLPWRSIEVPVCLPYSMGQSTNVSQATLSQTKMKDLLPRVPTMRPSTRNQPSLPTEEGRKLHECIDNKEDLGIIFLIIDRNRQKENGARRTGITELSKNSLSSI